jgi:nucleoside-diphosphate-sugar epimerase
VARRIVVTGSQGFAGRHLRQALVARECEVIGVDLPDTGAEVADDLASDSFDAARLAARVGPVDGVIHLAATISRGSSVDALARKNLSVVARAPVEIFEAFHAASSAHFVYCSSFKAYGPSGSAPIDPERPPQRPDPFSYGSAKALSERLLAISASRTGGSFAVVRSTCIYGPGQHAKNAIPLFLGALWQGQAPTVFGPGDDVRDDVLVADLAYCLAEACLRRVSGAFHAGGDRARTILEVAELCCEAIARLGGPAGMKPVIDASKAPKWWLPRTFDISRTRQLLDYEPTPMVDGLASEALWIRAGADPGRALEFCPPRTAVKP